MSWNIFSPVKKPPKRGKAKDPFDAFINVIEGFAPREHLSQREAFYYNYKMMTSSRKSLLALLETLSEHKSYKADHGKHACVLFKRLKNFYDPRESLSPEEALVDRNLIRRFRDLFLLFYGRENLSFEEIERWLTPLKIK
ncbi:MAG: hypothetical protein LJE96_12790 [Deltaproteobacteria bacterium]|nr:hypothetical protein [Deltaproteobacteria bacterium]